MNTPLAQYGRALRAASRGGAAVLDLVSADGDPLLRMDAAHWVTELRAGDESMLDVCCGSTLDVGCGPGRLVAALIARGVHALGIDVSAEAVRQARNRGASVLHRDVFAEIPGRWKHILLADGNIGIGGDPVRLLTRCRNLLAERATVVVETGPPGTGSWRRQVRLHHDGAHSGVFWWAAVAADDMAGTARASGLKLCRLWTEEQRWFATLACAD